MSKLKKIFLFSVDNLSSIAFGIISTVFIARTYGPENMGHLSYVQSVVSVFSFLFILGMDNIIMKEFVKTKQVNSLLASVILIRFLGFIVFIGLVYLVGHASDTPDNLLLPLIIAAASASFFGKSTSLRLYFQALENPKYLSIATMLSRFIAVIFIFVVLFLDLDFIYACQYLLVYSLSSQLILVTAYLRTTGCSMSYSLNIVEIKNRVRFLLRESYLLIISSALLPLFMYMDMIIIEHFLSAQDVGIYSAAVRLVSQVAFVGHILVFSYFKNITDEIFAGDVYGYYLNNIVRLLLYVGISGSILTYFLADIIILNFFGDAYVESVLILKILIWKSVFVYLGALFSRVLILKGLQSVELIKTLLTAAFSISFSIFFIQKYGLIIIPIISVSAYSLADFLAYVIFKETRFMFVTVLKQIFLIFFHPFSSVRNSVFFLKDKRVPDEN